MELGPILTASIAALTGIIGSVFTYLATRPTAAADAQRTGADADYRSAEGFQLLVRELRQERAELAEVIERQGAKIEAQSEEITRLRNEVFDLKSSLQDVMSRWRRGEAAPPIEPRGNR